MHKTRYNALRLSLRLSPRGPLLIKAGGVSANPTLPDMQFVRTFHAEQGETVYIPGSSLKGVVRGFVEQVLRTLTPPEDPGSAREKTWKWACATFDTKGVDRSKWSCPQWLNELQPRNRELQSWEIYANSCGACRIFGHTRLKGRVSLTDLFPTEEVKTEIRYGVAISRLSHAVAQGPFEMEVAVSGTFGGHLVLENFELWQLGMLALALESMNQGLVKVGFGKNRGFGEVNVQIQKAVLEELVVGADDSIWRGLGAFVSKEEGEKYRLFSPNQVSVPEPNHAETLGFYRRRIYDLDQWHKAARKVINTALINA